MSKFPISIMSSMLVAVLAGCAGNRTVGERVDDATITAKIKSSLAIDPTTKARQIAVDTHEGVVQLTGFVDSADERQVASRIARNTKGVRRVQDNLEVKTADRSFGEAVSDEVLKTRVKAALVADPATKAREITVKVNNGNVQLGGFVDSSSMKSEATRVAQSVNGVRSVDNGLEVRP
ncbi:MAG: BON domain-containing protein [Gammaproteobacteria bacterium]|nr:BON domain-containing protein [Gammaproteobacteria bacterium]